MRGCGGVTPSKQFQDPVQLGPTQPSSGHVTVESLFINRKITGIFAGTSRYNSKVYSESISQDCVIKE